MSAGSWAPSLELRARTEQGMELQEPAALGVYRCGTDSLGRDVWMVQREDPGPDPDLTNGET